MALGQQMKRGNGFIDMTGHIYNGCKVIGYIKTEKRKAVWEVECFCGNRFEAIGTYIRTGHKKSCGCLKSKVTSERNYKHGKTNTRLYHIWSNMKARCLNTNNDAYHRYGGRGISIWDDWVTSFENFERWALNNGYSDKLSIDRIDNNGNYEPTNCTWSDYYEQGRNKRNNVLSYYKGKMRSRSEISEMTGLNYGTIRRREQDGIDFDKPLRVHADGKYYFPDDEVHR